MRRRRAGVGRPNRHVCGRIIGRRNRTYGKEVAHRLCGAEAGAGKNFGLRAAIIISADNGESIGCIVSGRSDANAARGIESRDAAGSEGAVNGKRGRGRTGLRESYAICNSRYQGER